VTVPLSPHHPHPFPSPNHCWERGFLRTPFSQHQPGACPAIFREGMGRCSCYEPTWVRRVSPRDLTKRDTSILSLIPRELYSCGAPKVGTCVGISRLRAAYRLGRVPPTP
jgi:hypothetical protein